MMRDSIKMEISNPHLWVLHEPIPYFIFTRLNNDRPAGSIQTQTKLYA
jgi:hypothetical protein